MAAGDTVTSTALVHVLHEQYPDWQIDVTGTGADSIFAKNPAITRGIQGEVFQLEYPLINDANEKPVHCIEGHIRHFSETLDIPLVASINHPFLYVQEAPLVTGPYWLVCSGIKSDFTAKAWGQDHYQEVVRRTRGIRWIQVGERHDSHRPLEGAESWIGRTDLRQLIRLVAYAQGGLGGVSLLSHLFAGCRFRSRWGRPFVRIGYGAEPVSWQRYNSEVYLSKANTLPCGLSGLGCWKCKIENCNMPVQCGDETIPKCMDLISVDEVVTAIGDIQRGLYSLA